MGAKSRSFPSVVGLILAVASGSVIPIQSKFNGALAQEIGDPILGALACFGAGTIVVVLICFVRKSSRQALKEIPVALKEKRIPWFFIFAGFGGGFFILAQNLQAWASLVRLCIF